MTSPLQHSLPFGTASAEPPRRENLIIEAGAGTGKTTAIVAEVLKLLLGNEDLAPERIVLMTFTEKAAGEIADRIHEALADIENQFAGRGSQVAEGTCPLVSWPASSANPLFMVPPKDEERYRRATAKQLARIDGLRSQTIHSFCQSLLRMLPIEAGLDPQFKIIEGFERSLLYGQLYDAWVDRETRVEANPAALREWEVLLTSADYVFFIRNWIFSLVDRRDLLAIGSTIGGLEDVREMVQHAVETLRAIEAGSALEPEVIRILEYVNQKPLPAGDGASIDAWIEYFEPIAADIRSGNLPAGKGNADLKNAIKVLRADDKKGASIYDVLVSHRAAIALLSLTRRFIDYLDGEKRARGVLDFDDLLLRTAAVLEDPVVAERVRQQFDYIFVDEFQDTDRTQARIIERLATDQHGHWVPGKIIIVGDPKQSIYGFRRADPETYRSFAGRMLKYGAHEKPLDDNYRSDAPLLEAFNTMFACVFASAGDDPNVFRPRYRPLNAAKAAGTASAAKGQEEPRLTFLHARGGDRDERQIAEAESIAEWINAHRDGSDKDLQRFALLFRRLTKLDDYLDTFDRHGIRYVLPPTRAFLERRAPVDLLAVLRAIAHPFDRGALISAARTPYFALTDEEIGEGILGERASRPQSTGVPPGDESHDGEKKADRVERPLPAVQDAHSPATAAWQQYLEVLEGYRAQAAHLTVSAVIDLVVRSGEIERIYEETKDGVRSLRHLEHLRSLAFEYDEKAGGSLRQFIAEIDRRRDEPDEIEPSLADDDSNAVRILTVHAAKGLEFETVIIPDIASRAGGDSMQIFTTEDPAALVVSGGVQTLSARFNFTGSGTPLKSVASEREDAEMRRLFYVAATRAKSDVVFVCTPTAFRSEGFFKCLTEAFGFEKASFDSLWPDQPGSTVRELAHGVTAAFEKMPASIAAVSAPVEEGLKSAATPITRLIDAELEKRLRDSVIVPLDITAPPQVVEMLSAADAAAARGGMRNIASGTLLHRLFEKWDSRSDPAPLLSTLAREAAADERTISAVRRRIAAIAESPFFRRISAAETIGREMPIRFAEESGRVVERRIDRLVREDGRELVIDYKSGAATPERLTRDRDQVTRYCRAVEQMTGRPCAGVLWYIDGESDEVVEVD